MIPPCLTLSEIKREWLSSISAILRTRQPSRLTMRHYEIRKCDHCANLFEPSGGRSKWCSVECRFWSHVDRSGGPDACWPWKLGCFQTGYGQFSVAGVPDYTHRKCLQFSGIVIPPKHYAIHRCDNPPCCNPHSQHVIVGTPTDNIIDMYRKNRQGQRNYATGDRHGMSKLRRLKRSMVSA